MNFEAEQAVIVTTIINVETIFCNLFIIRFIT